MSAPDFIDTNILVYAYGTDAGSKQRIARDLVTRAVAGDIVTSIQVLAEFAATLSHRLSPPPAPAAVLVALDSLGPIRTVVPDADIVRRAMEAHHEYGIHFYDGMIVAAAERAGCACIWTEDLNDGQSYFGVVARNPFA